MAQFIDDLDGGEVHIRDRWQLELKSEFFPQTHLDNSTYIQEFYFFIPNSLQINNFTYKKNQFYSDQTNLIRYKTPEFSFSELLDMNNPRSPLTRILALSNSSETLEQQNILSDELKLFGNVVRSALREQVKQLVKGLYFQKRNQNKKLYSEEIKHFCKNINLTRKEFTKAQEQFLKYSGEGALYERFLYIDEFLSRSIIYYLTGLLENLRLIQDSDFTECDQLICHTILKEQEIADSYLYNGTSSAKLSSIENEQILYRSSLLNKFILDALLLHTNRFTIEQRYQHWIGGFAAGVAMLIYFSLFIWLGNVFVWNSLPFLLFTVLIYILKDRIKDWIKEISYTHAFKWFSDFGTVIRSPDEKHNIGIVKETFSFINENKLAQEIRDARNVDFHEVLENFQRPETVLFYKRTVEINNLRGRQARRYGLNIIFRFNIHRFLRKAGNPTETYYRLDPETLNLQTLKPPKVYHLDLIIRNIRERQVAVPQIEIKKLRIIIDKNGIRRIEQLVDISER